MSTTYTMRENLKKLFYGKQWAEKVDNMKDNQVIAIYRKFQREGKIK